MPEDANLNNLVDGLLTAGFNLLVISVILIIGYVLVRFLVNSVVMRILLRRGIDAVFVNFIGLIAKILLMFLVSLIALDAVGIETGFLVAAMAAVLIALIAAMQGWLRNVAAGLSMLLNNPFKLDDLVEIGEEKGRVKEITLMTTTLRTGDNLEIRVPNQNIVENMITNYDARERRRVDLVVSISYDDNIRKAVQVINEVLSAEPRVLPDLEPTIGVTELADHSVKFDVRPWVKTSDHGDTRRALLEAIKVAFDANGITIPFQQLQIHSDLDQSHATSTETAT